MARLAGKSLTETVDKVHLISERMRTRRGESHSGVQNDIRAGLQKTFVIKPHASIRSILVVLLHNLLQILANTFLL